MVPMRAQKRKEATHEPACSAGFPACGFTGLSSPVDQERATGKSPEPAGSKACATNPPRFMVPMRAKYDVEALHEPCLVWSPAFRRLERLGPAEAGTPSCQRFMVPMRGIKVAEALHEPENRRLADQRLTQIRFMVAMRPKKRVQTTHEPEDASLAN